MEKLFNLQPAGAGFVRAGLKPAPATATFATAIRTFAVAIALMLGATFAARAATGTLDVGSQTGLNLAANQSGTGWTWTASAATLTLTGNINGQIRMVGGTGDVVINVPSGSAVSVAGDINVNTGKLTINGRGTLNVSSASSDDIVVGGGFGMEIGGSVTVNASTTANSSYGVTVGGDIFIIDGTVTATCSGTGSNGIAVYARENITISGASTVVNVSGTFAALRAGNTTVYIHGGTVTATGAILGTLVHTGGTLNGQVPSLAKVTGVTLSQAGQATWTDLTDETGLAWYIARLYKNGTALSGFDYPNANQTAPGGSGATGVNFLTEMRAAGAGSYTVVVTAIASGVSRTDGEPSEPSNAVTVGDINPYPVFDGLEGEYVQGSVAVPLKLKGKDAEKFTVFKVNGEAKPEFIPNVKGSFLIEAATADGKSKIETYITVK